MKISMYMMLDSIASEVRNYSLSAPSEECCISGVLPYLPDIPITENHIYVTDPENAVDFRELANCFLIIYGLPQTAPLPELSCQHIVLHPEISFSEALSLALRAAEKYDHWYERMRSALSGVPDLNQICSIGFELLNNPILLFAPNHALVASKDVSGSHRSAFLEARGDSAVFLSDEAYKTIVSRPEYEDYLDIGRVSYMENPLGGNTLYANISCNQHDYRLCVNDTNRGFCRRLLKWIIPEKTPPKQISATFSQTSSSIARSNRRPAPMCWVRGTGIPTTDIYASASKRPIQISSSFQTTNTSA